MKKLLLVSIVGLALVLAGCGTAGKVVGGSIHNSLESFDEGIAVDGTVVIDGSGNVDAPVTTTSITASGNVVIGDHLRQAPGSITGTTTLTTSSENIQIIAASAASEVITLPAVATAGTFLRIVVGGAMTGAYLYIDSAEGDNISGTLIVAGAVVDCRDEDQINIITDGEAIGDYVELFSDGTSWYIVDSGVLTSAKMTCTDPS